jgi:hypothetical protein
VVGFVNSLPLVVIELKKPGAPPVTISRAQSDDITGEELLAFLNNQEAAMPKPRLIAVTNSRADKLLHRARSGPSPRFSP